MPLPDPVIEPSGGTPGAGKPLTSSKGFTVAAGGDVEEAEGTVVLAGGTGGGASCGATPPDPSALGRMTTLNSLSTDSTESARAGACMA